MAANGASLEATVTTTFQPIFNASVPKEGPKAIPLKLDFTAVQQITVDLTQQQQSARISFLQGAYIDNSLNPEPFSVQCAQSRQIVTIPPNSQAFVPLLLPNPPIMNCSTLGSAVVNMAVLNIPMDIAVWSVNGEASLSANGYLNVSDVALDALIAGGALTTNDQTLDKVYDNTNTALRVEIVGGGGGGGSTFKAQNVITNDTGASQTLIAADAGNTWELSYLHIYLDPTTFLAGGGSVKVEVDDSTNEGAPAAVAQFNFLPPTAAPTGPAYPILLWSADAMSLEGLAADSALICKMQQSGSPVTLSGSGLIFAFGYTEIA